jgi:hypothetical protein
MSLGGPNDTRHPFPTARNLCLLRLRPIAGAALPRNLRLESGRVGLFGAQLAEQGSGARPAVGSVDLQWIRRSRKDRDTERRQPALVLRFEVRAAVDEQLDDRIQRLLCSEMERGVAGRRGRLDRRTEVDGQPGGLQREPFLFFRRRREVARSTTPRSAPRSPYRLPVWTTRGLTSERACKSAPFSRSTRATAGCRFEIAHIRAV